MITYSSPKTLLKLVAISLLIFVLIAIIHPVFATASNLTTSNFVAFGNLQLNIGDTLAQVEKKLGKADRIDPSNYDFDWYVYNRDYSRFVMVGIKNGVVEALYTNSKGFSTKNAKYGDLPPKPETGINFFTDRFNGGKIYACLINSKSPKSTTYTSNFFVAQEMENFDATNAFRVNNGLKPLTNDAAATLTARNHSQDMANRNYFDHTNLDGLSPWDRYGNNNGKNSASAENIVAGHLLGINSLDAWINSQGHRSNILGSHKYLGVGYGYGPSSDYKTYMTQLFST